MTYIIDARLEQVDPQLCVIDSRDGHCCLQWRGGAVHECLARGGLCEQDFCCADQRCVQELVRTLFLLATVESIDACTAAQTRPSIACRGCAHHPCGRSWAAVHIDRSRLQ